jgi:hypothetical protein
VKETKRQGGSRAGNTERGMNYDGEKHRQEGTLTEEYRDRKELRRKITGTGRI